MTGVINVICYEAFIRRLDPFIHCSFILHHQCSRSNCPVLRHHTLLHCSNGSSNNADALLKKLKKQEMKQKEAEMKSEIAQPGHLSLSQCLSSIIFQFFSLTLHCSLVFASNISLHAIIIISM